MRKSIKKRIPRAIWEPLNKTRYALERLAQYPSATFHPWRRKSIQELASLRNKYQGERCFIIGNGPSLQNTDISKLKNEFTFGMNRVYLGFDRWGFKTNFLVCVNSLVIEQVYNDLQGLNIPKFISWRSRKLLYPTGKPDDNTHFLFTTYTGPKFTQNATSRLWEGATVTYVCLQLAFHMGFTEAILVGVDHSFPVEGTPNTTVVSAGDDQSHFDPEYFGKGFRWQLPDLDTSEYGYQLARDSYQEAGRQVLDATIGGKLQVFPKVSFESLFEDKRL